MITACLFLIKLQNCLKKQKTEIVAEDELETVSFSQNKAQDKTVKKDTATQEQQKTPVNTINEEPKQDEKKFVSIEVEQKPKTKPVKKEKRKNRFCLKRNMNRCR